MEVPFFDISVQNAAIREDIDKAISKVMDSNVFIEGDTVKQFEKEICEYLGVEYAISCANGTDALTLALRACGVGPGDEVITTAFSFFATAEAICSVGAKPVFVDIQPNTYLIDPDKIEEAITPLTKAIIPVQIFGACCDMDKIMGIAHKHKLAVIEDDAQAIGSMYYGDDAGTLADIGCFSFYPTKNLGCCGDGGMCTTNNKDLAVRLSALKSHGAGQIGADAYESFGGEKQSNDIGGLATDLYNPQKYYNYLIGCNSRLDAIQAAILSVKLKKLCDYNIRRRDIAREYTERLTNAVKKPIYDNNCSPCFHQYAILTDHKKELIDNLAAHGIGTGNFYPVPLHKQKAFNKINCGNYGVTLPVAEEVCNKVVCLPIYPELLDCQVDYVIDVVNDFFNTYVDDKPVDLFIHHTAEVDPRAELGSRTKIWNNVQVREFAKIGSECSIGKNSYIDKEVKIGDRVKVQNNVNVYRGVVIEDDVFLGPSMTFTNDLHPRSFNKDWKITPTLVKKGASIGAGAVIVAGVTIGEYAMVGAGSVVTKDVPDHTLVIGSPARSTKKVCNCGKPIINNCPVCGYTVGDSD